MPMYPCDWCSLVNSWNSSSTFSFSLSSRTLGSSRATCWPYGFADGKNNFIYQNLLKVKLSISYLASWKQNSIGTECGRGEVGPYRGAHPGRTGCRTWSRNRPQPKRSEKAAKRTLGIEDFWMTCKLKPNPMLLNGRNTSLHSGGKCNIFAITCSLYPYLEKFY